MLIKKLSSVIYRSESSKGHIPALVVGVKDFSVEEKNDEPRSQFAYNASLPEIRAEKVILMKWVKQGPQAPLKD